MNDCPRLGRWIGGCKFKPRYDTVSGTGTSDTVAFWTTIHGTPPRPTPARRTYLGDVCETCGKMLFKRRLVNPAQGPAPRGDGTGRDPSPRKVGT